MEPANFSDLEHHKVTLAKEFNRFQEACKLYKKDLEKRITDAIELLKSGSIETIRIDHNFLHKPYEVDGKMYYGHEIHYGLFKDRDYWISRDLKTWRKYGVLHPFKECQIEFAARGYYLQDISNPYISCKMYIIIGINKPEDRQDELWHGLNIIPKIE